jgi:hypothetical protein
VELRDPPRFGNPNSTFKPSNFKHPQRDFHTKRIYTTFGCLVISQPHPGGIKGFPRFKTPIPPSNPQVLNTHKEILINNKIRLFLDVW